VSYEQIVQLAFPGTHEPNAVFSVTYRKAAALPPAGELGPGGSVTEKFDTLLPPQLAEDEAGIGMVRTPVVSG
jgi:hypothetical protein